MNGLMKTTQQLYNADSMPPAKYSLESHEHGNSKHDMPMNRTLTNINSAQYFELDQDMVAKEDVYK